MQHKTLIIDANIVIRAVLGKRARTLIETYADQVAFYIAEAHLQEARYWLLERLGPERGLPIPLLQDLLDALADHVQVITDNQLMEYQYPARARIGQRDERDWPAVAAALLLDGPIWTEDADFFGAGIATWTTRTVELYLRDESP